MGLTHWVVTEWEKKALLNGFLEYLRPANRRLSASSSAGDSGRARQGGIKLGVLLRTHGNRSPRDASVTRVAANSLLNPDASAG